MPELWESLDFINNIDSNSPEYPNQEKEYVRRDISGTPTEAYGRLVAARKHTSDPELLRGVVVNFYRSARFDAHYLGVSVPEIARAIAKRNDEEYASYDSFAQN